MSELVIKNCNSIDEAKLELCLNKINIKHGINGVGKSTIVQAIECAIDNDEDLSSLKPFKYRNVAQDENNTPSISGLDDIKSVLVFNEEYVNNIVFQQDEIIEDSYDVFIRTKEYDEKMEAIESEIIHIKQVFKDDQTINLFINDLTKLSNSFGKSSSGIHKSGGFSKGLGEGNKLNHVPKHLTPYKSFLNMSNNVKWLGWQMKGNEFLEETSSCPYCTSNTEGKKDKILSLSKEYPAKSIEHLNKLLEVLESLGGYFSKSTIEKLSEIVDNKDGLSDAQITYLGGVRDQINVLISNLVDVKEISFFSFKEEKSISDKFNSLKIDLELFPHMDSKGTQALVKTINDTIVKTLKNIGALQGKIVKQKKDIQKTIKKYNEEINDFLKYAGYNYSVFMEEDDDLYKMKLKHKDYEESIDDIAEHLSYGERNAFSLVLFMYESLSKNADLIILDDPISSFDKTKKYAIIEMLFRGKRSFKNKTVLMMTHDFEPIVDIISTFHGDFQPIPFASFLNNKGGILTEIPVTRDDILSFAQVCKENIKIANNDIAKFVHLRRYCEILGDKSEVYQLLSNLFHKEETPYYWKDGEKIDMTGDDISLATSKIIEDVEGFEYNDSLNFIKDNEKMLSLYNKSSNNYEKLQIFRIINDGFTYGSNVSRKFVNETLHIENEYLMQLNPYKYDFVPQYIISECDEVLTEEAQ